MSTFYFCKMFKKVTGINFTDYLSRVRIEKAKNLLLNPNLRVSEIAFEVGFQSLTHFNRVFKKLLGQSPTEYARAIARALERLAVSNTVMNPNLQPGTMTAVAPHQRQSASCPRRQPFFPPTLDFQSGPFSHGQAL
jgi:AraC-like DNA-binding protein